MREKQQKAKREAEQKQTEGRDLYEWVQALVCSVLAVVILFTFVIRLIGVDGHSMVPTLQDRDRLLVLNSILLVSLMYDMCKVTLVQKAENENSVETVNEKEVKRIVESANRRCRKIQPVPEALAI